MDEFDAVTAVIGNGISSAEDVASLSVVIMRACLVPVGDHDNAKNLPRMLKVTRRMSAAGVGSPEWVSGVAEIRRLWVSSD